MRLARRWKAIGLWASAAWFAYFIGLIVVSNLLRGPFPSWLWVVILPLLILGALIGLSKTLAWRFEILGNVADVEEMSAATLRAADAIEAMDRRGPRTYGRNRKRRRPAG